MPEQSTTVVASEFTSGNNQNNAVLKGTSAVKFQTVRLGKEK